VLPVDDEFYSHVLVDQTDGSKVRVIDASRIGRWKNYAILCRAANEDGRGIATHRNVTVFEGLNL
jgi:hypothetical protein